ncbi:MAG TPA: hypothetical protein VKE41_11475 [Roseiflexaceae bacterium]|nr:hypothetical protein [Roseiflexaceae bacterium]
MFGLAIVAVLGGCGWPHDIADEEILARLLALNLERAAGQPSTGSGGAIHKPTQLTRLRDVPA